MAAKITDSQDCMIFQTTMTPGMKRQNKTDYAIFEGSYENDNVSVDFDIWVKYNYIKKHPADLIKNDHIILQNQKNGFFFLFQAEKENFSKEENDSLIFKESRRTADYHYTVTFQSKKAAAPAEPEKTGNQQWSGDVSADVASILEKYGLSEKAEGYSPVTEYMKKWSLEHPEKEWDIHGEGSEE